MTDKKAGNPDGANITTVYPPSQRTRRRSMPGFVQVIAIALLGSMLALVAFYILQKIGY